MTATLYRRAPFRGLLLSCSLALAITACDRAKDPVEGVWKLPGEDIVVAFDGEGSVSLTISSETTSGKYRRDQSGRLMVDLGEGERQVLLSDSKNELRLSANPSDRDVFLRRPVAALVDSAEVLFTKGYKARDCDSSITWYSQAITLLEDIPSEKEHLARAYNNRGICEEKRGDPDAAIADYSRAVSLDPGLELAYGNRAWLYDKLGRKEEALADYRKAAELGYRPAILWLKQRTVAAEETPRQQETGGEPGPKNNDRTDTAGETERPGQD
ncbi:tetratricopeptide repeat protein [Prosthecochloris sp. GSB1]|uniref:tetratricopeptide repeat protein n=1 Tax=Prosthecochloris sp. GSB1 TaxID=281093 RepID=UPI00142E28D9|nr:tetratricopeptide repeat protein [Prosthecochloris sp. GSB1]